ncbi:retrovirus-related pol polyprotein from transposon TNT 1-94 [Tanacetum coccineum]
MPRSHGGVIDQTRSERSFKHSYDSPLSGGNTLGSDKERIEHDDLTDFVPPTPHDSPLSGGHTPGSDEGRPNINELMDICTNLSNMVLALEQSKTAQDLVIRKLKKKVRKLEKRLRARTTGMKLFKIGTSKRKSLDKEYVSKQGRKSDKTKTMFDDSDFAELDADNAMENVQGDAETQGRNTAGPITTNGDTVNTASIDVSAAGPSNVSTVDPSTSTAGDILKEEMMTIADTLVAITSTRPRTTSVVIRDVEEELRRATLVLTGESQDKGKGKMVEPEHTLKNPIKAQIQRDAEIAQRLHEEEKAELERMQRERVAQEEASNAALIAEFDNVQARMEAYALRWKESSKQKRPRAELDEESVKRQKIGETSGSSEKQSAEKEKELSEEELQKLLVVVPVKEVYVEALQICADMLKKFDRDDLVKLWDLVKRRFSTTKPTNDKEKKLWVELKRLFEPDNDDILWKIQRYMHDPLLWKLYDTCGVHHVSSVRGHDIFMLVEKEYPLTRGTLGLMMVARLLVEANSEMSRELLRKIFYQANRPRKPTLDRVFGSKCFILNTKDYLTKFDPKSYEGVFLGYSQNSKAYIILNKHTRKIEESLNVTFDETPPPSKTSPLVDDDLDKEEAIKVTKKKNLENDIEDETLEIDEIVNIKESRNHPLENVIGNLNQRTLRSQAQNQSNFFCFISTIEPKNVNEALTDESWIVAMQEELNQFIANDVWELVPQPRNMTIIGTKWVFRNKLDENGVVSRNKARLVAQGYNQQEGIDYDETYAPVARLESIRILLAYAYALDFKLFQMDVKSAFLNGFINEEVYVAQPPGFIDFEKPELFINLRKLFTVLNKHPKLGMMI